MIGNIAYILLTFLVAVTIHELGHYLAGRMFHVRMKSFNIFWGPGFKLFSSHSRWFLKLFPSCKDKIEVTVGWLPIFAYVMFCSEDDIKEKDSNGALSAKDCIMNRPAWQKLIVFSAGLIMNLLTVFAINVCMLSQVLKDPTPVKVVTLATTFTGEDISKMANSFKQDAVNYCRQLTGREAPLTNTQKIEKKSGKGAYYTVAKNYKAWWSFDGIIMHISSWAVVLFCMNIIPVPPLDGGKMLFSIYEIIARRKISESLEIWISCIAVLIFVIMTVYDIGREIILDIFWELHRK